MEVVIDKHAGQIWMRWLHVGRCRSTSWVRGEGTDDTRSYSLPRAQLWVGSRWNRLVFPEGPKMGRYEKASVR